MADGVPKVSTPSSEDHNANPNNIFTHFVYKAALVTVFLLVLPLFPSLAPDILHARSWELLQLIFVGISVSYGLFSKKNDDIRDKDVDNPTSYVSKLLQVSSVFYDESDDQTHVIEENKFESLNSQYYREEPVVVVAKESTHAEGEGNDVVSQISQRPLLLPVRSLKQRVTVITPNGADHDESSAGKNISRSGSRIGDLDVPKSEEKVQENVVLRSPIPWRMEVKENGNGPPEQQQSNRLEKATSFKMLSETQAAKTSEDVVRKKVSSSSTPAPPPPPPPPMPTPQLLRKSVVKKSNSTVVNTPGTEMDELPRRMSTSGIAADRFQNNGLGIRAEKDELLETESEAETEDDHFEEGASDNDVGRDVDKEADEFIAKFREQIRLQRIESIRRTTAQRAAKNLRGEHCNRMPISRPKNYQDMLLYPLGWLKFIDQSFIGYLADEVRNGNFSVHGDHTVVLEAAKEHLFRVHEKVVSTDYLASRFERLARRYRLFKSIVDTDGVSYDVWNNTMQFRLDCWVEIFELDPRALAYKAEGDPMWDALRMIFEPMPPRRFPSSPPTTAD